jgi:hypothetical protein
MVAIYALLALNVMGGLLAVGREYLEYFCCTTPVATVETSASPTKEKKDAKKAKAKAKRTKVA